MALSEVTICNMALSHLGISREIADVDGTLANSTDAGTTIEHQVCSLWYERSRDRLLESYAWPFARGFATLSLADDGDSTIWTDEWENAYTYPADCLRIRRFVNDVGTGSQYFPNEQDWAHHGDRLFRWRYVIRQHGGTKVILTDVATADADIEYTRRITDPTEFDEAFADALSLLISYRIATPLSVDSTKRREIAQEYNVMLLEAKGIAMNEEHDRDEGDEEILRSRDGIW